MAQRDDFTDEEWLRIGRAPLVAGMAISLADPGGPLETLKESGATLKTVVEAAGGDVYGPFVQALARDVSAMAQRRQNPLAGFRPHGPSALDEVIVELRAVAALVRAKVAEQDFADYREWLRVAAQRAALAAREGGFLGIGGEQVSQREQDMLERLGELFGVPRS